MSSLWSSLENVNIIIRRGLVGLFIIGVWSFWYFIVYQRLLGAQQQLAWELQPPLFLGIPLIGK